jgi:hypothetical protein
MEALGVQWLPTNEDTQAAATRTGAAPRMMP